MIELFARMLTLYVIESYDRIVDGGGSVADGNNLVC